MTISYVKMYGFISIRVVETYRKEPFILGKAVCGVSVGFCGFFWQLVAVGRFYSTDDHPVVTQLLLPCGLFKVSSTKLNIKIHIPMIVCSKYTFNLVYYIHH